jgi:xylulokinase
MDSLLLGIDIGTTGCKVLLIDSTGAVRAKAAVEYPFQTPHPLWAEQDPADWWRATVHALKTIFSTPGVQPQQIAGVGLTGQMHGLVLLDASGNVLRPCIMWNDQRTTAQCSAITAAFGRERVLALTGNQILPGFTAPKIAWVRSAEPGVYSRISKVLLPKDYVRYMLTGTFFSDVSDASGTSLFNVAKRSWSDEMLAALEIPRTWLPDTTESATISASVSHGGAMATGLLEGTPVVAGAGDQAAQAVGSGVIAEGVLSVTTGTSGVVFAASSRYRVEPQGLLHAFCHAVPQTWHLMGVMLSAGGSFRWYRDTFGGEETAKALAAHRDPYDVLIEGAETVAPGAEGLLFLPYLTGERTPYADPHARGVFFGMTLRHTRAHFTRAVLEGVTFGLRDSLELVRSLRLEINQVRASGGGAKSAFWCQMMADIFHTPIVALPVTEGAAFGAALLAGIGAGIFPSVQDACGIALSTGRSFLPGRCSAAYDAFYAEYRTLYASLRNNFDTMAGLMHRH